MMSRIRVTLAMLYKLALLVNNVSCVKYRLEKTVVDLEF